MTAAVATVLQKADDDNQADRGKSVLVTGATGFIGSALVERLAQDGFHVPIAAVRSRERAGLVLPPAVDRIHIGNLTGATDWSEALEGIDVVVHAAAKAHESPAAAGTGDSGMYEANVEATLALARQSLAAGIKRFVFLGTVGVFGLESGMDGFTEESPANPASDYARSKWRAEQELGKLLGDSDMQLVILRAPMVYGKGAGGKFERLYRLVERGVPLPFASIQNRRSFIAIENMVSLVLACIDHPAAANQVFIGSDSEDLSTPELIRRIAAAMGKRPRLIPFPAVLLRRLLVSFGKSELASSMLGSFRVDAGKAREMLGWEPRVSIDEALQRVARQRKATDQDADAG